MQFRPKRLSAAPDPSPLRHAGLRALRLSSVARRASPRPEGGAAAAGNAAKVSRTSSIDQSIRKRDFFLVCPVVALRSERLLTSGLLGGGPGWRRRSTWPHAEVRELPRGRYRPGPGFPAAPSPGAGPDSRCRDEWAARNRWHAGRAAARNGDFSGEAGSGRGGRGDRKRNGAGEEEEIEPMKGSCRRGGRRILSAAAAAFPGRSPGSRPACEVLAR